MIFISRSVHRMKPYMWLLRHLHLELRKISCEIDSMLGTQMTFKMACYFGWIAIDLREIFYGILIKNMKSSSRIMSIILHCLWCCHNVYKFLLINYTCETVITKVFILHLNLQTTTLNLFIAPKLIKNLTIK